MNFTKPSTTDLTTRDVVKAAKRAQAAGSAAAENATSAAQNAAIIAQHAAEVAQTRAQHAAEVAQTRAQDAAVAASRSAHNASDAAQMAAGSLSKNVKDKLFTARIWAAPRLESAADYTTSTVAPKVSAALRSTADRVSPVDTKDPRRRVLTWSVLGAAIAAGLGAAAALIRIRYRAAIAADSETAEEEVLADSTGSQAAPGNPDASRSKGAKPADPGTDSSANGRVKASGW